MTTIGGLQIIIYVVVLVVLSVPLGDFMAKVYEGERTFLHPILAPVERITYRLSGIKPDAQMGWKTYALAMLAFSVVSTLVVYTIQRVQAFLPLNPENMAAVSWDSSFNTATSFATNTNWQGYGGESTMSYFTQMIALAVQNFVSAAVGMAVLVALIRGFVNRQSENLGNFWVDLVRSTIYILLPLSLLLALVLVSQGVVQTFGPYVHATLVEPSTLHGKPLLEQVIAVGPAASQIAIKQLGTNGGGFFNVNSAHPFENPTGLSNFLECLAILIISAALCHTFGKMVKDRRQGWALLAAMLVVMVPLLVIDAVEEQQVTPAVAQAAAGHVDAHASALQSGGNMEGKEARFGVVSSAIWAVATTCASNGSVNSMHDSFTPIGGMIPMWLIQLGEVIFGGVGSGLYGLIIFAIVAVFVAGLMVGRTPEYLGKKIEAFEMQMASLAILVPPMVALGATALAVVSKDGIAGIANPGVHGFSEVLYAFSSQGNNNGSAFGGISANTPFYNVLGGIVMLLARYWVALPALAIAGSLSRKKIVPVSAGTLPTHGPLFVTMLVGVVLLVGALTFLPALALGPIAEQLRMVQ
jgi:K+-transporting ATPase ATPase A chain